MSDWYYAHGGEQKGPVPVSELRRLAETGEFDPEGDLVWREGMSDWKPAQTVEDLRQALDPQPPTPPDPAAPAPPGEVNPYAAPLTADSQAVSDLGLEEIQPGSQPIEFSACIARGFELTKRHFGIIFATGATYLGIYLGAALVLGALEVAIEGPPPQSERLPLENGGTPFDFDQPSAAPQITPVSIFTNIVSQILSVFLGLGVTRIGLSIVDGRPASVSMMFGEGGKLLRAIGAGIIYAAMVTFGLFLLIVPGIYLALRFGQYHSAIVDRDMGVFDSLAYSSQITTNNRMNLFILAVLSLLIVLAGLLAFFVGLILAYPIIWLAALVAYRWMQYGPRVVMDTP